MPTYSARCPECGTETSFVSRINDRNDTPVCEHDGVKTERMVTAAMTPVMGLADHYKIQSASGKTFYGASDYKKFMKANGLLPSSDLAGEAPYQKKQKEIAAKKSRRKELTDLVMKYTP